MAADPVIDAATRPRLAPGVRLHFDKLRDAWVLLAPERVLEAEGPVREVLSRCDGMRSFAEIIGELAALFAAEPALIEADVRDMLVDLHGKRMLLLT
jgi:pyrroloquinoline quinone biosynthesis protein D